MRAVKQVVNLFINIVVVGLTRSRRSEAFSRAAGNDLRFFSSWSIIQRVEKHKEMFVFCFGSKKKSEAENSYWTKLFGQLTGFLYI